MDKFQARALNFRKAAKKTHFCGFCIYSFGPLRETNGMIFKVISEKLL
jgi:hypothetical protein